MRRDRGLLLGNLLRDRTLMPKPDNLAQIAHLLDLLVTVDPMHVKVELRGKRSMSPDQARALAIELLYAADEAEGEETLGAFGYTAEDSYKLGEIYMLIDEELGWDSDEQEVDGDYAARIRQVGKILERRLRLVKS